MCYFVRVCTCTYMQLSIALVYMCPHTSNPFGPMYMYMYKLVHNDIMSMYNIYLLVHYSALLINDLPVVHE